MRAHDQRMAFLCIEDDTGRKLTKVADFGLLTLSTKIQGGYGDRVETTQAVTPAAAEAFWDAFSKILPLRGSIPDHLDVATWDAKFHDGETIRTVKGIVGQASYQEILRLFDLLG
jgi:hypothetical protein